MASSEYVTLRPARDGDLKLLNAYNAQAGMDDMLDIAGVTVAVEKTDTPVGHIRIAYGDNGVAHVNPVVVYAPWRGIGVGRALMEDALERTGELRLIARGESVPFYRALGFAEIPWEDIAPGVTDDCSACTWRDECSPVPMGRKS